MTKKEKGKFNPFVGELRPDEEILWLHVTPITLPQDHNKRGIYAFAAFLSIFYLLTISYLLRPNPLSNLFVSTLACVFAISIIGVMLLAWVWIARIQRPSEAYAVTNQRLLHYDSSKITMLALEDLDVRYESGGALSFNVLYLRWHNVPDAKGVLRLIEKAAENRVADLREKRFDDEKRKGQVQSIRR